MTLPLNRFRQRAHSQSPGQRSREERSSDRLRSALSPVQLSLDEIFEMVERRRLSAPELRLLLALVDHDAAISDLAGFLGRRASEVRRTAARLYARGLVSWRNAGRKKETVLGLTPSGLAVIRPLLTAAGQPHVRRPRRGARD